MYLCSIKSAPNWANRAARTAVASDLEATKEEFIKGGRDKDKICCVELCLGGGKKNGEYHKDGYYLYDGTYGWEFLSEDREFYCKMTNYFIHNIYPNIGEIKYTGDIRNNLYEIIRKQCYKSEKDLCLYYQSFA